MSTGNLRYCTRYLLVDQNDHSKSFSISAKALKGVTAAGSRSQANITRFNGASEIQHSADLLISYVQYNATLNEIGKSLGLPIELSKPPLGQNEKLVKSGSGRSYVADKDGAIYMLAKLPGADSLTAVETFERGPTFEWDGFMHHPDFDEAKVEIVRQSESTTQGIVEIRYAGEPIVTYGDDKQLVDGQWQGAPDAHLKRIAAALFVIGDPYNKIEPIIKRNDSPAYSM